MKKYESIRNGERGVLIRAAGGRALLELENGQEKDMAIGTLKRWWKAIDEDAEDVFAAPEQEEEIVEQEETTKTLTKDIKPLKSHARASNIDHSLKDYIEEVAESLGTEVFETQARKFKSLKIDNKMYAAFTYSSRTVILWLREKAVGEIEGATHVKHMFNLRKKYREDNLANREEILLLLKQSKEYQQTK